MLDIPAFPEMLLERSYVEFPSEIQPPAVPLTCYAVEAPFDSELLGTFVKPWCPNDCHETQRVPCHLVKRFWSWHAGYVLFHCADRAMQCNTCTTSGVEVYQREMLTRYLSKH